MPTLFENAFAMWTWPLQMARLGSDVAETMVGAHKVINARLPLIDAAMRNPFTADHVELSRMVSEKVDAIGESGRSMAAAGTVVRTATESNAKAARDLAGGRMLWPADWFKIAELNVAAMSAMAALPAAALAPIHRGVVANQKRLRGRAA